MRSLHIQYFMPYASNCSMIVFSLRTRDNGFARVNTNELNQFYWCDLLNKCELNSYTLFNCSLHMLHFQGLLSLWHPLWRKYKVWSGNSIPQNWHWSIRLPRCPLDTAANSSSVSVVPVEVIAPFDVVATAAKGLRDIVPLYVPVKFQEKNHFYKTFNFWIIFRFINLSVDHEEKFMQNK